MKFLILLLIGLPVLAWQAKPAPESEAPGRQIFAANCSFCHGVSARGGAQGGPDLTNSSLAKGDQLGAFLKVGRPGKGMPAFNLSEDKVQAIAVFLRSVMQSQQSRRALGAEVLVGDAVAGKAFFNGEGQCIRCHSAEGNLKGIGTKYPPAVLQGRMVLPVGDGAYPGPEGSARPPIHATVLSAGSPEVSGTLVFLSDYAVTVLTASGERRTFPRRGDDPKITTDDPLQAHLDRQSRLTDRQMHDLTAYLATLK